MKTVSNPDQNQEALKKRINELNVKSKSASDNTEVLLNTFRSLNLIAKNANAVYSINEFDIHCKFTYVSPSIKHVAGYDPDEMIGKSAFDFVHPKDKKSILLPLISTYLEYKAKNLLKGELKDRSKTFVYRAKDKNGKWRYAESTSNLVGDKLIMVTTDIGEKKDFEQKLKQTKVDYYNLLSNLDDIYYRINKDGIITDINPAIKVVSGYEQSDIIGKHVKYFFRNDEMRYNFIDKIKKNGIVKYHELDFTIKDGSTIYVSANAYIIKDVDGNPIGIEGILHNNTKQKVAELALRENESNMAFLAETAIELYQLETKEQIYEYVCSALYKLLDKRGIIFIVDFDGITDKWEMKSIKGIKPFINETTKLLGFDIRKMKGDIKTKYYKDIELGKLSKLKFEISDLTNGLIPKKLNSTIKKLFSIKDLYCICFKKDVSIYGNVTFITTHNTKKINSDLIETFIVQVSTIIAKLSAERNLHDSEKSFRDLYDNATDAIYIQDKEGVFLDVNEGAVKMYGYPRDFFIGKTPEFLSAPCKNDLNYVGNLIQKAFNGEPQQFEFWGKRQNGEIFPKIVRINKVEYFGKEAISAFALDITNRVNAQDKILEYQKNLKTLSNALIETEEKERRRLANLLHDSIGQLLATAQIKLSSIANTAKDTEVANSINDARSLLVDAMQKSRDLTYELSPPILYELGLVSACKWYAEQLFSQYKVKITISNGKIEFKCTEELRIFLFRIICELMKNIVKHSHASSARISFAMLKNQIKVVAEDNGVGFNVDKLQEESIKGKKFGLFSLSERIEFLGGQYSIDSKKGGGTKITLKVPI